MLNKTKGNRCQVGEGSLKGLRHCWNKRRFSHLVVQVTNILGGRPVDRGNLMELARDMFVARAEIMKDLLWCDAKAKHQEKESCKELTYMTV